MAAMTWPFPPSPAANRREEILEWHSALPGLRATQVLGVAAGADPAAVRAAFVSLARRFHPDSFRSDDPELCAKLQQVFIRITEAYHSLGGKRATSAVSAGHKPTTRGPQAVPKPTQRASVPAAMPAAVPASGAGTPSYRVPASVGAPLDPETKHVRVAEALRSAAGLMAEGETTAAVSALHEVLGLADQAERKRLRLFLARTYVSEPRWRRNGLSLLEEMLRESPADAEALAILGALYHREGLLARAEATLRRALASDPGQLEAQKHLRAVSAALEKRRTAGAAPEAGRPGLVARLLSLTL